MWPRDLLVPAFKNARVATYSYKSDWKDTNIKTSLRQCAEQLLNVLVQHRQDADARQRPLILIGHRLGGLIIQQALVIAVHQQAFKALRLSVAGIVFLGAPFQGSDAAIYGKWLAQLGRLDMTLIKSLEKDNPALHALSSDFWHSYNDWDIVCFYENKDAEYGPWKTRVVTAQSASLLGKRMIFLDTDHSGLNKFGIDDENFALILPEIQRMVKEGASVVRNRLRKDAGRPETPPNPSSNIPFRRDPDFVDRGTILDQLHQKCISPASRTALVGLGGVGKSQLAIEYGYRTRERSSKMWVFWVHAGSIARFEQNYRDIADHVEIPGRKDPKANVFKLVHDFLGKEKHGEWLLILDNIDNALFPSKTERVGQGAHKPELDDKDLQSPLAYLPQSQNGRVLITTRSREVALELVEERDIVTIEPMAKPHALALLKKKLSVQGDSEDVSKLVVALDFMPLAIVQAAAYISQRAPRYSVGRYLEDFQKSDRKKTSLLNYEGGQLRRDWEAKNSIIITWQISFEYIRHSRPSAADLLSLMSFFDRQGIPDSLIRNRAESRSGHRSQEEHSIDKEREGTQESDEDNKDSASISSKDDEFEDDVQILRDYSFISTESDRTFEMHALVQLATRKWLEASGQLEQWKQRYIRNLSDEFPPGRYENWMRCQELFPHAKSAVTQQPKADESLREWALLLYNAAWYAEKRGNVVDAIQLSGIAMKVWEKILGQEHRETLNAMTMVVSAYILGGRWDEAEELGVQVMKTRKKVLDEDHPETISIKGSLALIYWNQGRWKEAGGLNIQLIETEKRVLGEEHPDTLTSISNLSLVYINQGLWKEAEKLNIQVIETKKRVLGEEHPDTLTGINNLASTYWNQGRWKEAEELNIQVIETRKRVLGEEHPNTLTSTSNLSLIYLKQDRLEEAEELDIQVIEAKKRVLGEEHPDTLASISNLSSIYLNQGRWKEAEELGIKLIGTKKRVLGVEHPVTLGSISNLASTYWNQGRWKEAEELEIRVIETQKKVLGEEHPDTLRSMKNLAWVWKAQDRSAEAIELMKECVSLRNRVLGTDHPDTLLSSEAVTEWETEEIQTSPSAISAENH